MRSAVTFCVRFCVQFVTVPGYVPTYRFVPGYVLHSRFAFVCVRIRSFAQFLPFFPGFCVPVPVFAFARSGPARSTTTGFWIRSFVRLRSFVWSVRSFCSILLHLFVLHSHSLHLFCSLHSDSVVVHLFVGDFLIFITFFCSSVVLIFFFFTVTVFVWIVLHHHHHCGSTYLPPVYVLVRSTVTIPGWFCVRLPGFFFSVCVRFVGSFSVRWIRLPGLVLQFFCVLFFFAFRRFARFGYLPVLSRSTVLRSIRSRCWFAFSFHLGLRSFWFTGSVCVSSFWIPTVRLFR